MLGAKAGDVTLHVVVLMLFAAPNERDTMVCRSMVMMIFKCATAIYFLESGRLVLMVFGEIAMTVKRDV